MRYKKGYGRLAPFEEYASFSIIKTPTACCGLWSVQWIEMGTNGQKHMLELLEKHVRNKKNFEGEPTHLGFIATHVRPRIITVFKDFGFKVINTFTNPNTGNEVSILFYQDSNA